MGRPLSTIPTVDSFTNFNVSPDGSRIAATRRDPVSSLSLLWVIDAARGVASVVAPKGDEGYGDPIWMPDGEHLVFRYQRQLVILLKENHHAVIELNAGRLLRRERPQWGRLDLCGANCLPLR